MKVAIYARVSTLNQALEGYSISEQTDALNKYCEAMGYTIYDEYVDAGFSGGDLNRPAMQKLIKDVKNKKLDAVVIYNLDRMSRSVIDTLHLVKNVFLKNDVQFICLKMNIDTTTVVGELFLTLLSAIAEFERANIKERMALGRMGRAKSGKAMSWGIVPFGYRYVNGDYVINDLEATVVKEMFEAYITSESITDVVAKLNEAGHIGKDVPWSYRTVKMILENPVYKGYNSFKGNIYKGNHEAIIDDKAYSKAQELMDRGRRKSTNERPFEAKYLLSGLIRCGECGAPMNVLFYNIRKDGTRKKVYWCKSNKKTVGASKDYSHLKCDNTTHEMEELEYTVMARIEKMRLNPDAIAIKDESDTEQKIEIYTKELDSLEVKQDRLLDLYIDGTIDKSTLEERRESITEEIINIEEKINELKQSDEEQRKKSAAKELTDVKVSVLDLSYDQQFKLVRNLLDEITVYKDKVALAWTFE